MIKPRHTIEPLRRMYCSLLPHKSTNELLEIMHISVNALKEISA